MKAAAVIAILGLLLTAAEAQAQCATASSQYQVPSSTSQICFTQDSFMIPESVMDWAATQWNQSSCAGRIPIMVSRPSGSTIFGCNFTIPIRFTPNPNPADPNRYASFDWEASTTTNPPTLIGASITCYVNPCTPELLAHEMGHALGLDHPGGACDGHIMRSENPGMNLDDACSVADAGFDEPDTGGETGGEDTPCGTPDIDCTIPPSPEYHTPIVLNLGHGPYALSGLDDVVHFDIDGDGLKETMGWTERETQQAFLFIDRNANGAVDDGTELFGQFTPSANGTISANAFEALGSYDSNRDGVVDRNDDVWSQLFLWFDANGDAASSPSEIVAVRDSEVRAFGYSAHWTGRRDEHGNIFRYQSRYLTARGVRQYYDIYFVGH